MESFLRGPGAGTVLYVGAAIPKLSETFVYREILALEALGVEIAAASVHTPETESGNVQLESLAAAAIPVYAPGAVGLLSDAAVAVFAEPRRLGVLMLGLRDALLGRDVPWSKRPRIVWQCLAGLALATRVRTRRIAHVHAHMAHVPASIAMYTARALGVPFSFTGHAVDLFAERTLLSDKLRRCAFVACISAWHRDFYRSSLALDEARMPIVRCGVDIQSFVPERRLPGDGVRILAVGRMVPKKGFDLLLRALAEVRERYPEVHATIVGDGPEMDRLHRLRHSLKLEDIVELPGALPNDEVRRQIVRSDLFVLPCRVDTRGDRDGIPVVLMEAMACAVPVIAGDIVTIRELVEDGVNGFLVPPENVAVLAEKILDLAGDAEARAQLGAAARRKIEEEFDIGPNAAKLLAAIERSLPPGLQRK